MMSRMKELEARKMYVEETLKAEIVSEALQKTFWSHLAGARRQSGLCNGADAPLLFQRFR